MKAIFRIGLPLALAGAIGACSTTGGGGGDSGVQATRFHLNQPIAASTVAIEPLDPAMASSLEFRTNADAVARQLTRLGWTVETAPGRSERIARVDVRQGSFEALRTRSPVSVGIGGGTGGWSSGVGGGISFPLGGRGGGAVVGTMMEGRITRRSDGTNIWEGRAETRARADSPSADPAVAVERLADALFGDFPGESGRTIRIR